MAKNGFSLIELLIAIAIVGIISAIAYPSYSNYVVETRRHSAAACIVELAHWMERYYSSNMTYADAELPDTACQTNLVNHYSFDFDEEPNATSYMIVATAETIQASRDASCETFSVDQQGTKEPELCWKK